MGPIRAAWQVLDTFRKRIAAAQRKEPLPTRIQASAHTAGSPTSLRPSFAATNDLPREPAAQRSLVVVAAIEDMGQSIATAKLSRLIVDNNIDTEFWGRARPRDLLPPKETTAIPKRILLPAVWAQKTTYRAVLAWLWKVFAAILRDRPENSYFCVNFESAFPAAVASLFVRRRFLFANFDNISLSYRWPKPLKYILSVAERFAASRSAIHLIPDSSRWNNPSAPHLRIVPSTPPRAVAQEAQEIARVRGYRRGDLVTVYIGGWLKEIRGLGMLLEVAKASVGKGIRFILAGAIECPQAGELVRCPNVEYHGLISPAEALALNYKSHLVASFYDPSIEISRVAIPNKWFDCILTQTPFVTNAGVLTAQRFIEKEACLVVDYDDAAGLLKLLESIRRDPEHLERLRQNLASFSCPLWDDLMLPVLKELTATKN